MNEKRNIRKFLQEKYHDQQNRFQYNRELYQDLHDHRKIKELKLTSKEKFSLIGGKMWREYLDVFNLNVGKKAIVARRKRRRIKIKKEKEQSKYDQFEFQQDRILSFSSVSEYEKRRFNDYYTYKQNTYRRVPKKSWGVSVAREKSSKYISFQKDNYIKSENENFNMISFHHQIPKIRIGKEKVPKKLSILFRSRGDYPFDSTEAQEVLSQCDIRSSSSVIFKNKGIRLSFSSENEKENAKKNIVEHKYANRYSIYDYGKASNREISNDGFIVNIANGRKFFEFLNKEEKRGKINEITRGKVEVQIVSNTDGVGDNDNSFLKFYDKEGLIFKGFVSSPITFFKGKGSNIYKKDAVIYHHVQLRNVLLQKLVNTEVKWNNFIISFCPGVIIGSDFKNKILYELQGLGMYCGGLTLFDKIEGFDNPYLSHKLSYLSVFVSLFTKAVNFLYSNLNELVSTGKVKGRNLVLHTLRKFEHLKGVPLIFSNTIDINPLLNEKNFIIGVYIFHSIKTNTDLVKKVKKEKKSFVIFDFRLYVFEDTKFGERIVLNLNEFCFKSGKIFKCFPTSEFNLEENELECDIFPCQENYTIFRDSKMKLIYDSNVSNAFEENYIENVNPLNCYILNNLIHSCILEFPLPPIFSVTPKNFPLPTKVFKPIFRYPLKCLPRKAWGMFKSAFVIMSSREKTETIPDEIKEKIEFGYGAFLFVIGLLPEYVAKILSWIGFKSDRDAGVEHLKNVVKNQGFCSIIAGLMLHMNFSMMPSGFDDPHQRLMNYRPILDFVVSLYPESSLFRMFSADFVKKFCDYKGGIKHLDIAIKNSINNGFGEPLNFLFFKGMSHIFLGEYDSSYDCLLKIVNSEKNYENKIACFIICAFLEMKKGKVAEMMEMVKRCKELSQSIKKPNKMVKMMKSSLLSIETFCCKDDNENEIDEEKLMCFLEMIPFSFLYLMRDIAHTNKEHAERLLKEFRNVKSTIQKIKVPDVESAINVIEGMLIVQTGDKVTPIEMLQNAVKNENKMLRDIFWIPFAQYELAELFYHQKEYVKCKEYVTLASKKKGYSFDQILKTRCKIALKQVNQKIKQNK